MKVALNNGWPLVKIPKNLINKGLTVPHDLNEKGFKYLHPYGTRIPIGVNSFQNAKPELDGHTKSIIVEIFGQNNIVWVHIPTAMVEMLNFSIEEMRKVAVSWTDAISMATGLNSSAAREQGVHNKGAKPSSGWHQDAPHSGQRVVTVFYHPKEAKYGHFEYTTPANPNTVSLLRENPIYRIPNNSNSYTIASFRDDLFIHRGQKRQPLADSRLVHNFESFQRFQST